ncbi:hypothetical protein [Paenisporosarcina antarctica]|uniref:Uncharacterized protein n=1 Tax=Paenisporosarcina antarctica TaxID=417367 RepID=A0A4P6ZUL5_9BACL|nr:hypothetical protein [Paenisporosarcina antarctica]QBP40170.1 hypothetical protein E2636_02945 [Paenisporosarcina antarctica]
MIDRYYRYNPHQHNQTPHYNLYYFKNKVLNEVEGIVQYELKEAQYTSYTQHYEKFLLLHILWVWDMNLL